MIGFGMAAGNEFRLQLRFWGVRGSTPTPQIENLVHGGNTSCLEVRGPNNEIIIFDGGTGLRQLGNSLLREYPEGNLPLNFFLTHFHWDHIQGIPFFAPVYAARTSVTFFSLSNSLQDVLESQMTMPFFPVRFDTILSKREFVHVANNPVKCGAVSIFPFALNHPQGCIGYRIECGGAVIVYASDLEHGNKELDRLLRDSIQGADILIYDSQYTPEEYEKHKGWGHSTWEEAARAAKDGKVNQLILFHHEPTHNDQLMLEITRKAQLRFDNTIAAREGLVLTL
jgi:phosphoribosyl 1,2-cyclic phosphodiesterase